VLSKVYSANVKTIYAKFFRKTYTMGLLDQVLGAAGAMSSQSPDGANPLSGILNALNSQEGGLSGLVQAFENGGLGDVVKSWISTGQNLPVSAEQIRSVLGNDQVRQFASSMGIDPDQAASQLSQYLPQVVDQLSPNGSLSEGNDLMAQGMNILKGKLFG
jgi:uncharacterized protein YidB (DUF937 family)